MGGAGRSFPDTAQNWDSAYSWINSTFAAGNYFMPLGGHREYAFSRINDAQDAIRSAFDNLFSNWASPEKAEEAGEEAATSYLDGWDTMIIRPDLAQEAEGFLTDEAGNAIKPIGIRENWEEYLKTITDMVPKYEEAGADAGEATVEGFGDELKAAEDQARTMGEAAALAFGSGIASKVSYVAAQASALAAAATARMQTARSGVVQAVFNVDGRQMATALAPYNNEIMAVEDYGDLPFTVR